MFESLPWLLPSLAIVAGYAVWCAIVIGWELHISKQKESEGARWLIASWAFLAATIVFTGRWEYVLGLLVVLTILNYVWDMVRGKKLYDPFRTFICSPLLIPEIALNWLEGRQGE